MGRLVQTRPNQFAILGDMTPKTLLVVYHTMTGGTEQMAQAAVEGARDEPGVQVRLLRAPEAQPQDVLDADGYVFATPENLAAMAGLMKDFFDRCYYPALDRINGRPYAALVCAGSDGQNAVRQPVAIRLRSAPKFGAGDLTARLLSTCVFPSEVPDGPCSQR